MKPWKRLTSGFTLVEILLTLGIIAVALAVYTTTVYSVFLTRDAKHQEIAVRIANNELEGLRALGYAALPASGSFSDSQLSSLAGSSATVSVTDFNAKTKKVTVTVSWQEPGKGGRVVTLSTLITKTGGLK